MPNSYCYNALIDAFGKAGRTDDACALFQRMERGLRPNCLHIHNTNQWFVQEALKLWDTMIDKSITPTPASFMSFSTGLCLSGKLTKACKILDDLTPWDLFLRHHMMT